MSKCGIYMIKNKINDCTYIGQAKDIDRRWDRHKYDALHNVDTYLYRSIRKYGISNFEFSIVELCDVEELDAKEIFYIKKYNTCICNGGNGYNLTTGGDKVEPKKHPIFCLTNGVAYNSITEASEVLNIPSYTIRAYCKANKINKYKSKQLRIDNHANGRERKYLDDFCYIEDCGDILEGKGAGRSRKAVIAVPSMKIYSSKCYLENNDISNRKSVLTFEKFANKLNNKKYWNKERYIFLEDFLKVFPSTDIDFIEYIENNFCKITKVNDSFCKSSDTYIENNEHIDNKNDTCQNKNIIHKSIQSEEITKKKIQINMDNILKIANNVKPSAILIYLIVKAHDGVCTAKQIADEIGMTTRNVHYLLNELIDKGYVTKTDNGFGISLK